MNDMSHVIVPKSDQINADTLLGGPMTVTIREVHISGGQEQPVNIVLEETPLFYRPCKSMSRCLVSAWGPDAKAYIGRSLTLYRDPSVKWGGLEVGGIRISHMSNIDSKMVMQLTATKGQRKPHTVMPLTGAAKSPAKGNANDPADKWTAAGIAAVEATTDIEGLEALLTAEATKIENLAAKRPDLHQRLTAAIGEARARLDPAASTFGTDFGEGTPETDRGELFATDDDQPEAVKKAQSIIADAKNATDNAGLMVAKAEWTKHGGAIEAYDAGLAADVSNEIIRANDRINPA